MKKVLLSLVIGIVTMLSLNSCAVSAYSQEPVSAYDYEYSYNGGNSDISVVIRYGTPYYFENTILYYLYNGWYYYPYYYGGHYYYYRYRTPFPVRPGYRFAPRHHERPYARGRFGQGPRHNAGPGHHGNHTPNHGNHGVNPRPHDNHGNHGVRPNAKPNGNGAAPHKNDGGQRVNPQPRPVIPNGQGSSARPSQRPSQPNQGVRTQPMQRPSGSFGNSGANRRSSTYQTAPRPSGGFSGGSRGGSMSHGSVGGGSHSGGSHGGGHFGGRR